MTKIDYLYVDDEKDFWNMQEKTIDKKCYEE